MSSLARQAIDWTRRQIGEPERAFLAALPLTAEADGALFVHASANDPGAFSYVTSDTRAAPSFRACAARLIFCGHTHVPLLVSRDPSGLVREQAFRASLPIPLLQSRRWLAVVGAVGQPRDGVPQAAWALWDSDRNNLSFRRTAYDVARTAEKIRAAGLPEDLALRLLKGR
jgi:diadenosine tetraphosphatase ApaH/serine/threonine PP2A family protein phosphatase